MSSVDTELDIARRLKFDTRVELRLYIKEFMKKKDTTIEDANKIKELAKKAEAASERYDRAFNAKLLEEQKES